MNVRAKQILTRTESKPYHLLDAKLNNIIHME